MAAHERTDMANRRRPNPSSGDNGAPLRLSKPRTITLPSKDGKEEIFNLSELKEMSISALTGIARRWTVPGATGMRKAGADFQSPGRRRQKRAA
jgi:hypothetical protein